MSKRSKKSTASSGISEVFVPTIPEKPGTDPSTLPFPVWSDQEVNAEEWDVPKRKVVDTFFILMRFNVVPFFRAGRFEEG